MYADRHGYRTGRSSGLNPTSLGIAVAINGALIAALMASHADRGIIDPVPPLKTYNIPVPPPPVTPPPRPIEHRQPVTQPIFAAKPIVELPHPTDPVATTINLTPPQPLPAPTGPAVAPEAAPPPALVTIGAEIDPAHRADLQPAYPPSELRAEREGVVTVRVLIGVDGRVRQVEQVAATSDAFFRATQEQAMRRWRFRPATRGGIPIETTKQMTIRFVIPR